MGRYIGPKSKIARKFGEAIFGADRVLEKRDERDGLATPLLAVEPDAQVLSFGGEGFDLRSLLGVVFEIRVGRIDHSQSRFPVVRHV